jgi:hypothetical protein
MSDERGTLNDEPKALCLQFIVQRSSFIVPIDVAAQPEYILEAMRHFCRLHFRPLDSRANLFAD